MSVQGLFFLIKVIKVSSVGKEALSTVKKYTPAIFLLSSRYCKWSEDLSFLVDYSN